MELCSVTLAGFRRLRTSATLKTNGKLLALVGPNEAGKSSILDAIVSLGNDEALREGDIARGMQGADLRITGRFFLDKGDLEAAGLSAPSWIDVTKRFDGSRTYVIRPENPERDLQTRGKLAAALNQALEKKHIRNALETADPELEENFSEIVNTLQSTKETLTASEIEEMRTFVTTVAKQAKPRDPVSIRKIDLLVEDWARIESAPHPRTFAIDSLKSRLPSIIVFSEDDRNLQSEYDVSSLSTEVPDDLENLCAVAKLNVGDLISAHGKGNSADVSTIERAANKILETKFQESWKQSGVHVSLRLQGGQLVVQVVNEDDQFTSFAERSDGLRQFVALQSFATTGWSDDPILIIDEAEQKLHYDAQADLVQMLARQNVAAKIVYTTHSAGCLPEDLGNGVHFVRQSADDKSASQILNKFWAESDPGFAPLLFGMGASTLAFFPTRNAVMVEGPSDILLLPTMLRETLGVKVLGFQIVPGLAEESRNNFTQMFSKKSRIGYVLDGDDAGVTISRQLVESGVNKDTIFLLRNREGTAIELEDFLDSSLLLEALNTLLAKFHGAHLPATKAQMPSRHRMKAICNWYKDVTKSKLPKVELAYEVLDLLAADPSRCCLDSKRAPAFDDVAEKLMKRMASR